MIITAIFVITAALTLASCSRTVRSPKDELTMFIWRSELDSANTVELSFRDDRASFSMRNESFIMTLGGHCIVDDTTFVICDDETRENYSFSYILRGDSVELSYNGGTIVLDKAERDSESGGLD